MRGQFFAIDNSRWRVGLSACNPEFNDCETDPAKIDSYLKELFITVKVLHHTVDFKKYGEKNTQLTSTLLDMYIPKRSQSISQIYPVMHNSIVSKESFLHIFESQSDNYEFYDIGKPNELIFD